MLAGQIADLMIMGTRSNDRLGTLLIGDHCRKAIKTVGIPLLMIPPGHHRPQRIGEVVLPAIL